MKRPSVVTLVGDLSFRPDLASVLDSSGCTVRRIPALDHPDATPHPALYVVDGDDHLGSDLDRVRSLHATTWGADSPVLLLMRGSGIPAAVLAYRDGVLDVVGADANSDAVALRIRSLAALATADSQEAGHRSLTAAVIEAPDGFALISSGGEIEFANRALLAILGVEDEGSAGGVLQVLSTAEDPTPFLDLVPGDGTPWHGDLRLATESREAILAATARRVSKSGHGETRLVILRDVTRVRLLERNMANAQRMDAVGHLAGGVAHDFNNILSVITTLSDLLMRLRPADDPDREDLQEIFDSAQRGSEIARQLSAFSRPGQGQPEVLELAAVVRRNEKMLRRLMGERIDLSFDLAPETGSVRADPIHLDQLILNLALNAREALPDGGVVRISTASRALNEPWDTDTGVLGPGAYAALEVTDSGQGMDEPTRQRLFEPFFTTRGWGRHSGLGLSVVHGTVVGAGGGIEVHTSPGAGTTFKVLLPAVAQDVASPESGRRRPDEVMTPTSTGETVLLVEDHEVVRRGLSRALESAGYRVVSAPDGESAVGLVRSNALRPHLVLTDVVMPSLDGVELERGIRDLGLAVPVIFMSGYPDHPEVERLRRSGVQVLTKPIDLPALGRLLRLRLDEGARI